MKVSEVKKGVLVIVDGGLATITKVIEGNQVEVQRHKDRSQANVNIGDLVFIPTDQKDEGAQDGQELFSRSDDASPEEVGLAKVRFDVLTSLRDKEIGPKEARARLDISNGLLYKLLNMYDSSAGPASLVRIKRGRKKGVMRLSEKVEELIGIAIKKVYKGKASTYAKVWKEVEALCLENTETIPCLGAVTARVKKLGDRELHKRKYGSESAHQRFDARPGKVTTSAPLQIVQMDHTLVDVILVDDISREPLGRPWMTAIIDLHTRVILGYYLSLNNPSTLSVACAMTHAVLPKNKYLERLGVPLATHPFYGIPKTIGMDNAKEFRSANFVRACTLHGITPNWRPLGKKHYGGHIERLIGTFMTTEVHFLPGATFSNVVSRRGYDSEKNSALSFKEFTRWFAGQVAIYHNTKHSSIDLSPKQAWDAYYRGEGGSIEYPPLIADQFSFKLDFMPEEIRSIHPWGISLHNKRYWSPALTPYIGGGRAQIKYDPFSMGTIWAKIEGKYIAVNFSDITTEDFSYEEHNASLIGKKLYRNSRRGSLQDKEMVAVKRQNEKIVADGILETKKARRAKAAKSESVSAPYSSLPSPPRDSSSKHSANVPDYSKRPVPFFRDEQS